MCFELHRDAGSAWACQTPQPPRSSQSLKVGPGLRPLELCPRPCQCLYCPGLRGCYGHRAIGSDSESRTLVIVGPGRQSRCRGLVLAARALAPTCFGPRPGPRAQSLSHYVRSLALRLWGAPAQAATAGPEPESRLTRRGHGQGQVSGCRAGRDQQNPRATGIPGSTEGLRSSYLYALSGRDRHHAAAATAGQPDRSPPYYADFVCSFFHRRDIVTILLRRSINGFLFHAQKY